MNPYVTQLVNQTLNQAKNKAFKAAPGFVRNLLPQAKQFGVKAASEITKAADDLISPVLRGIGTKANPGASQPQVVRSLGPVQDLLIRPVSRWSQERLLNPLIRSTPYTFYPGGAARNLVSQRFGRSTPFINQPVYKQTGTQRFLQEYRNFLPTSGNVSAGTSIPTSVATPGFPLGNPLTKLQGAPQYLLRQGQGLLQQAQSVGPTALNPLASRVPTTKLGQVGSFLNPLNPINFRNLIIGQGISTFVPEDNALKGNLEILAYTPGPWYNKVGATILFGATDAGPRDEMALIRQQRQAGIKPYGGDASIRNDEGKYWAGRNWGFQSPESFNKLYNTNLSTDETSNQQLVSKPVVPPVIDPSLPLVGNNPGADLLDQQQLSVTVVPPAINTSLPLVGNTGALTGNALYKAAREAGYDNLSQLGLSQWANYHQGRLPKATAELADTVELEEAKARKFLDTYLKKGEK